MKSYVVSLEYMNGSGVAYSYRTVQSNCASEAVQSAIRNVKSVAKAAYGISLLNVERISK